jgi:phage replication O-like protein O
MAVSTPKKTWFCYVLSAIEKPIKMVRDGRMKKIKPFEPKDQEYTIVDNVIFDYIMPSLSPNAWKVLCLILRKTRGWHKEWDGLAYSQIKEGTGIKSDPTVNKALNELLEKEFIRQVKGDKWDAAQYALNTTIEIEVDNGPTIETIAEPTIENKAEPTIDSKDTKQTMKQTMKQKKRGAAEKTPPSAPSHDFLTDVFNGHVNGLDPGVADPSQDIEQYMEYASQFVDIYHRLTSLRPAKSQKPKIERLAEKEGADLDFWEKVVDGWMGVGWNPRNIDGMIDCYERREIPSTGNGGKPNASRRTSSSKVHRDTLTDEQRQIVRNL